MGDSSNFHWMVIMAAVLDGEISSRQELDEIDWIVAFLRNVSESSDKQEFSGIKDFINIFFE